jgi:antitoxin (DNA-binding transcriptional repressor) of toxin-antitoxin stability system
MLLSCSWATVPIRRAAARGTIEDMTVVHVTEAQLAEDVRGVLEKVEAGADVVVERGDRAVAIIVSPRAQSRTISESIAIAGRREGERGYSVTLDPDFAADVEEIVRNRQPWNPPEWD